MEADFNQQLFAALEAYANWINTTVFPQLDEAYHMHLTCITNLFDVLEKKALIAPDPYKNDKRMTDIVAPDGTAYSEGDRAAVLGARTGEYEAMVDYVCNYVKFSLDMKMDTLNKMLVLNKTFLWSSFSANSPKPNTRGLAAVVNIAKSGAPGMTLSLLNENVNIAKTTSEDIEKGIMTVLRYKREAYKAEIRKRIIMSTEFCSEKAYQSPALFQTELRTLFPKLMPKVPYASEIVDELIKEETANNKAELRAKLLASLSTADDKKKSKKKEVDTHALIMDVVKAMGGIAESYEVIITKVRDNHAVMQSDKNSFMDKLKRLIRSIFGIEEPPVDYEVVFTDSKTNAKHKETVHYNQFIAEMVKRAKYYSAAAVKGTPAYEKMNSQSEQVIFDFVSKQITENNRIYVLLGALDEYFKENVDKYSRSKIKGLKMELTTLKNVLQKVNQLRADYASYVEEKAQMKSLGINEA
ncbi:MAG TPA: hypothetical protein DC014_05275 [Treponema sp.]|nr:hypothetical protein [Treponema sp.]